MAGTTKTPATGAGKARARRRPTPLRLWGVRLLVALLFGGAIGAGAGVFTVNKLEPGRGTGVDSLAVMLDSIAKGAVPTDETGPGPAQPGRAAADTTVSAAPALVAVPALVGLEEGAARNALLDAGLDVGEIQFQSSPQPAGTVLACLPVAGAMVPPDTPVTLVLSDGRAGQPDSLTISPSGVSP